VADPRDRSIRTLAWLGDAEFERAVRRRLSLVGDYPTDRLDAMKADVVRAEAQAALLRIIEPDLDDEERAVAGRGRNAARPAAGPSRRDGRAYRAATGFEALVAWWALGDAQAQARFEAVVGPHLDAAIAAAVEAHRRKPRRG
jgi:ribonuclease-3 family protein